jgi:hypothetical protein
MMNGMYYFKDFYLIASLLALLVSFWLFFSLRNSLPRIIRLSLISAALLCLLAYFVPAAGVVLTLAFVPSFIYHSLNPLYIAPFIVALACFVGTACALVLVREVFQLLINASTQPHIGVATVAFIIFMGMCYSIRGGATDYRIVLHAQQIARYAPVGDDTEKLKNIYLEVAQSTDTRMMADTMQLLALNLNSPPELLNAIYRKTSTLALDPVNRENIYRALIKNPNTTSDLFESLMLALSQTKTTGSDALPSNNNVSQNTILQLAYYPDCEVRRALISYPNVSEKVLAEMSQHDPDIGIRHDARQRLEFIRGVSHLENSAKTPAVERPPLTVSPLKVTSMDSTVKLREIFDNMPDDDNAAIILESLASNCFISDDLARSLYNRAGYLKHYSRLAILKALASNPQTPIDILTQLAAEKDLAILRELASNPNLPNNTMTKLAGYPDCKIRKRIICSPDTSSDLLKSYRYDKDESVASEAANRLSEKDGYLQSCVEIKKLNASCQKYYNNTSPDIRLYPNTSFLKSLSRFSAA